MKKLKRLSTQASWTEAVIKRYGKVRYLMPTLVSTSTWTVICLSQNTSIRNNFITACLPGRQC